MDLEKTNKSNFFEKSIYNYPEIRNKLKMDD